MSHGVAAKTAKNGARKGKIAKVARKAAKKASRVVVISRPTNAEETRRAFGIGARRWKHIQDLVEEVLG